jgi:hypothetical protein
VSTVAPPATPQSCPDGDAPQEGRDAEVGEGGLPPGRDPPLIGEGPAKVVGEAEDQVGEYPKGEEMNGHPPPAGEPPTGHHPHRRGQGIRCRQKGGPPESPERPPAHRLG